MRVLDAINRTVRDELTVSDHPMGHRVVRWGAADLCDDGPETLARVARYALAAAPITGKRVAWIGGGLCVGPRLFALADCTQTVYELEPPLREFCPEGVEFIAGNWRDNITGTFDVIVFDLAAEVPYDVLTKHLAPNGVILPKKE